jgi:hypothetical protein
MLAWILIYEARLRNAPENTYPDAVWVELRKECGPRVLEEIADHFRGEFLLIRIEVVRSDPEPLLLFVADEERDELFRSRRERSRGARNGSQVVQLECSDHAVRDGGPDDIDHFRVIQLGIVEQTLAKCGIDGWRSDPIPLALWRRRLGGRLCREINEATECRPARPNIAVRRAREVFLLEIQNRVVEAVAGVTGHDHLRFERVLGTSVGNGDFVEQRDDQLLVFFPVLAAATRRGKPTDFVFQLRHIASWNRKCCLERPDIGPR